MSSFRKKERQSTPDLTCGTDERVKILGNSCINGIEREIEIKMNLKSYAMGPLKRIIIKLRTYQ